MRSKTTVTGEQGVFDGPNRAYSDSNPPATFLQTLIANASVPTPASGLAMLSTPDGKSLYMKASDGTTTMIGPPTNTSPSDHNVDAWSMDPAAIPLNSTALTAGALNLVKLQLPSLTSINTVFVTVATAGATLTNVGFALYSAAGALMTSSVNTNGATATAFQSTGVKTVTFTTPQIITGYFYVGFWSTGTTQPALLRASQSAAMNFNLSAPNLRFATANSGLTTAAPATLGTQSVAGNAWWVAVS